jgi:CRISPR-associated protein Cmr1
VEAAGDLLRRFRQDRFRPQGRSRWPEPNALRLILKRSDPTHVPPPGAPVFFPRAALGLPIVFHFKSETDPSSELVGQSTDRLASPLVIRPHRLADGKLAVIVLVLNTPWEPPGGLALRYGKRPLVPLPPEAGPIDGGRFAAAVAPLSERRADDALSAFLRYVGGMPGAVLKRIGS